MNNTNTYYNDINEFTLNFLKITVSGNFSFGGFLHCGFLWVAGIIKVAFLYSANYHMGKII